MGGRERGRIAIIGGSVAGLIAAVALARRGWQATVVERDPAPATNDGDEAFVAWERRHVPQFRQPHNFSARSRNLLLTHIPEVVDRLVSDGIEEVNLFKRLAPQELWRDEDDAFTGLWTRRPAFELAIRRTAEAEPGVRILSPAVVTGLCAEPSSRGARPRITGCALDDGTVIEADVVLDCGGRRTPVPKWLGALGVEVPADIQDCESIYLARYYRANPAAGLPLFALIGVGGELESMTFLGFPGDHDTYGIAIFLLPEDDEMKILRHDWAWEAITPTISPLAMWVDPGSGTPLTGVQYMGGHQNIRRYFVVDGRPIVLGLLPIGDSLCTTNPIYGWGASMALTYAFGAIDAIDAYADDPEAMALAYDDAVREEADAVYRESAAMDRSRTYRWRGEEVPDWDRAEVDRQNLIGAIAAGALRDPVLGRAQLRRMNLLESPAAVLDDPLVVERAKNTQQILASKPPRKLGPDRAEMRQILAAAAPY